MSITKIYLHEQTNELHSLTKCVHIYLVSFLELYLTNDSSIIGEACRIKHKLQYDIYIYIYTHTQSVPGGMDKTSGECSLC